MRKFIMSIIILVTVFTATADDGLFSIVKVDESKHTEVLGEKNIVTTWMVTKTIQSEKESSLFEIYQWIDEGHLLFMGLMTLTKDMVKQFIK